MPKKTVGTTKGVELVIKNSKIGSGKISRRIFAMYKGHYHLNDPNLPKRVKSSFSKPPSTSKKKQLKFPNESIRIVFLYWNRLGYPFVHHREIQSKATARSFERINRAIKHKGKDEVIKAIARCHKLFDQGWFKYRLFYDKTKLSLHQFFHYDSRNLVVVRRKIKDVPVSWFKECLKGDAYLKSKYSVIFKDKNPSLTQRLLAIWKEYDGGDPTNRVKNNMIITASIVRKFAKINNLDINMILEVIDKMLNEWRHFKPKHSGYFNNKIFWDETFPKELERYGVITDRHELQKVEI